MPSTRTLFFQPTAEQISQAPDTLFRLYLNEKYRLKLRDFHELRLWVLDHLNEFWSTVWDYTGIIGDRTWVPFTPIWERYSFSGGKWGKKVVYRKFTEADSWERIKTVTIKYCLMILNLSTLWIQNWFVRNSITQKWVLLSLFSLYLDDSEPLDTHSIFRTSFYLILTLVVQTVPWSPWSNLPPFPIYLPL